MHKKEQIVYRTGAIDRKNIKQKERRVPIVISSEAPIITCNWEDGCYPQVLRHAKDSIVINRENIKLLDQHDRWGLPLGRLENIRLDGDVLRADAIFSKANPKAEIPWQMVQEKTLDEISVGAKIIEKEVKRDESGKIIEEIVTKWELIEASLVAIGADANAGINRNYKGEKLNLEEINRKLGELTSQIKVAKDEKVERELQIEAQKLELQKVKLEKEELEREMKDRIRKEKILNLARSHNLDENDEIVSRALNDNNKTEKDLALDLLNRKADSQPSLSANPRVYGGGIQNEIELHRALTDSLIMRSGMRVESPHQDANRFATASLLDIARTVTGLSGELDRQKVIQRAMTTDAFPTLLSGVVNRTLAKG